MSQPLPVRPLPTICVVLYSVLLAIIPTFVLSLLFASAAAPRSNRYGDVLDYLAADRLFWEQFTGFYFQIVLPISATLGLIVGVLVGRSRRREPGEQPSVPPLHAVLIGAASGGCLLVMALLVKTPDEFFSGGYWLGAPAVGGIGGAVIGFATWVLLTRRSVHPLFRALAGGVFGPGLSLPLFLLYYLVLNPPTFPTGYSHPFAGLEPVFWYVSVVLPISVVLGLIAGAVIHENRTRRRSQDEPQSRVE